MMDEVSNEKKSRGLILPYFLCAIFIICVLSIPIFFWILPMVSGNQINTSDIDSQYFYDFNDDLLDSDDTLLKTSNLRLRQEQGQHNATYNFETLDNVDITISGNNSVEQVSSFEGHNDVMKMTKTTFPDSLDVKYLFSSSSYGSVELWMYLTTDKRSYLMLNEGSDYGVYLYFKDNEFLYYDGSAHKITDMEINVWYHMSIDFECQDSGYVGLASDMFNLTINGIGYGSYSFKADIDAVDNVWFYMDYEYDSQDYYVDGLGISWLGYENSTNLLPSMENTEYYEVSEQCFHQIGYETIASDIYAPDTVYTDGYLGWNKTVNEGFVKWVSADFYNPEFYEVSGMEGSEQLYNNYINLRSENTAPNGVTQFWHNVTKQEYGVLELTSKFQFLPNADYESATVRFYNGSSSIGIPVFQLSGRADNSFNLLMFDKDLNYETIFSEVLLQEVKHYSKISGQFHYYRFELENGSVFDGYTTIGNSGREINQYLFETIASAGSETNFGIDDLGIYVNGTSLIDSEYGYIEHSNDRWSDITRLQINNLYGNAFVYSASPTYFTFDYHNDEVVSIFNQTVGFDDYDVHLTTDCFIMVLDANYTLKYDYEIVSYDVWIRNNSEIDAYMVMTGGLYEHNTSYFYSENNYLNAYCYSTDSVSQYITAIFDITNFDVTNTTLYINELARSSWLFTVDFRVYFTDDTYYQFELDDSDSYSYDGSQWKNSFAGAMPSQKTVDYVNLTITPNSNAGNTFIYCSLASISFNPLYDTPFDLDNLHNTGILSILVPIIALLTPSFIIPFALENKRKGMAKKTFVPVFIIFSIVLFASGIIPLWLFFITLIGGGVIVFAMRQQKSETSISVGLSLQAKKDKLKAEQKKYKDRKFKDSFKYQMAKYKALEKRDKYQTKKYKRSKRSTKRIAKHNKKQYKKWMRGYD